MSHGTTLAWNLLRASAYGADAITETLADVPVSTALAALTEALALSADVPDPTRRK